MATKEKNSEPEVRLPEAYLPRLAYSMEETAGMLGVSYITVHRLIKRGLLKSSKALRHKLIALSEIERFLAQ
jgi:excisionase family DNA binding protein